MEAKLFVMDEKYRKEKEDMEIKIKELERKLEKSIDMLMEKDEEYKNMTRLQDVDIVQLITENLLYNVESNEIQIIMKESLDDKNAFWVIKYKNYFI